VTILTSNPFDINIASGTTVLATAATALGAGGWSLDPIAKNGANAQWDISWQNRTAFYDDTRSEIQYMGKPQASAGGRNRSPHFIYDEATNSWTTVSLNVTPNSYGHIWLVTFDHWDNPGDYYHVGQKPSEQNASRSMLRYDRSANTWALLPNAPFNIWNDSATPNNGMVYHPNLRGAGLPGVYCFSNNGFCYFDITSQTWTNVDLNLFYSTYGNWRQNTSLYVPGLDLGMFGSGENGFISGRPQALFVLGGSPDDTTPPLADMPGQVTNADYSGNDTYHMILDPTDTQQRTVMLLQRTGGNVYTSTNPMGGLGAWTLQSYSHPFSTNNPYDNWSGGPANQGSWTCCSIPRYGVVMALGSHGGGGTMLWRPG
jgi:hypothetical protein